MYAPIPNYENSYYRTSHGSFYDNSLFYEITNDNGYAPDSAYINILSRINRKFSIDDRINYSIKLGCSSVFINDINDFSLKNSIENCFLAKLGLKYKNTYWYKAENGQVMFGIVYFLDNNTGQTYKLPISAWETGVTNRIVYDFLFPDKKLCLYNSDRLRNFSQKKVVIFSREIDFEYISANHLWIFKHCTPTCYASIESTDFSLLEKKICWIIVDDTKNGCIHAKSLYSYLKKCNIVCMFHVKCNIYRGYNFNLDASILSLITPYRGDRLEIEGFLKLCKQRYNIDPLPGHLPKAIPASEIQSSIEIKNILLKGLLCEKDIMMLHADRGMGKSYIACLFAVCFSLGMSALNAKICPPRKYNVLYIDVELGEEIVSQRLEAIKKGLGNKSNLDNIRIRSAISENATFNFEESRVKIDFKVDINNNDIIIFDGIFSLFPSAMSSNSEGAKELIEYINYLRKEGKTAIFIDHESKHGNSSYGTMLKEVSLDTIIRITKKEIVIIKILR